MDHIANLHKILSDAQLPSAIEDLKNPTEEFVIHFLTRFLQNNSMNVQAIKQPFPEQRSVMPKYEDSDVILLINLYAMLLPILQRIFLHDFCITDITTPGQKRFKKLAKYISNFVLYTLHKKELFTEKMKENEAQAKMLEELRTKLTLVLESVNKTAIHKAKELPLTEKYTNIIQQKEKDIVKLEKKDAELDEKKYEVQKENQESNERYNCVKTEMGKIIKELHELESQIVDSPETYQSRVDELHEAKDKKLKERNEIEETIQDKKENIKHINEKLIVVKKLVTDELSTLKDALEEFKNKKIKVDDGKKQIDSLNNIIDNKRTKVIVTKDQIDAEMNEVELHHEQDLAPLCNLFSELMIETKEKKANLETMQTNFNEKCSERNNLTAEIKKKLNETAAFIEQCQALYDKELAQEHEIQAHWKGI